MYAYVEVMDVLFCVYVYESPCLECNCRKFQFKEAS